METRPFIDRIIFGDNQFFGINHMSENKAQTLAEKFKNITAITNVLDIAYDSGIRAFMLNTHDRARDICDHLRKNSSRYSELNLYVSMPYAHKYANVVAEKGIFGALKDSIFNGLNTKDIFGILSKGSRLIFDKDIIKVMQILIDIEMQIFHDLNVKVMFLQNIVTDLLLGLGVKEPFLEFTSYVREKYCVEPGFITLNMPKLVDFLLGCGLENPIVCSAINKAGYFMNPDITTYEKKLKENRFRPIAMSILASGAIDPEEALDFVCRRLNIQSIVFGASSERHIVQIKQIITKYA